MKTIAVVDDDIDIGNMLQELLEKEGYRVLRAYSGTEALLLFASQRPDLILLDLMLPGMDGEKVLPKIKGIPVIVVSAKVDVGDKVSLLLGGAADYITKPFETREMLARIAVQLRKASAEASDPVLEHGSLHMELSAHNVRAGRTPVRLTKTEFAILKLLLQNPSQVMTKSQLLEQISLDTPDCVESSLKVHVSNLRKKLREAGGKEYIESVWGIGFKLQDET